MNPETANDYCHGTFECVCCGEEFTTDNPCCCDDGTHEDGSHDEGICQRCCAPHHPLGRRDFVNQRGE
jgi:hypothetical protein